MEREIRPAIANFKTTILYSYHDILGVEDADPLNLAFQAEMNADDWSKFQAFLARSALFYQFVSLPVDRGIEGTYYISGEKLLECFKDHQSFVITFSANKTGDEFWVLIPRNTPIAHPEELARVLTRNPDIWTSQPFKEQNPRFISHPKIWFYENRRPNPA